MTSCHAGRRVLVTGATRGIGLGIARRLAAEGAGVALVGRNVTVGETAAASIRETGGSAQFLAGDLRELDQITELVANVREALGGGIDTLCHAAGIYPERSLEDMTIAGWNEVMNTNLTAAMLLTRDATPDLKNSDYGRVVMISSITGPRVAIADLTHYAASKGGLEAFVRAAAVELAGTGVTVNAVAPGTILTEALEVLYAEPGVMQEVESRIPVGRIGTPDDIAAAVSFLSSREASFITGQSLIVDGGQTLPEVQS